MKIVCETDFNFNMPVSKLELSVRAANALVGKPDDHGIWVPDILNLRTLVSTTEKELLRRPKMSRKVVKEIKELLAEMGLELGLTIQGDKCIVFGCANRRGEGTFVGDLCAPCHHFITTGVGDKAGSSQIYRNAVDHFTSRLGIAIRVLLFKLLNVKDEQ